MNIIGREKEIKELGRLYNSNKAEFVAIYGRRRVGKTFLVDETLKGKITFRHAGLSPVEKGSKKNSLKEQLKHFYYSLQKVSDFLDGGFLFALTTFGRYGGWQDTTGSVP